MPTPDEFFKTDMSGVFDGDPVTQAQHDAMGIDGTNIDAVVFDPNAELPGATERLAKAATTGAAVTALAATALLGPIGGAARGENRSLI